MARGYPDFLITPGFANFGFLYRVADFWHLIASGATYDAVSIAGPGRTLGGNVYVSMPVAGVFSLLPRLIVDGVSIDLPLMRYFPSLNNFGQSSFIYNLIWLDRGDGYTEAAITIQGGFSWGLSFILQFKNTSAFDMDVDTTLYYSKVEKP